MNRTMNRTKNRTLTATIAIIAAMASTFSVAASELRIALPTQISNFDVQNQTGNDSAPMLYQVYDTLIERDLYAKPLQFKPGLATEWKQIEPTVWELKLRQGVKMHDGTIMDADDVAFSLNRVFHHEDPEFFATWGRWYYNFTDVEVIDPATVRIHTVKPEPLFEILMSSRQGGITSKEHYDTLGFAEASLHPVGTGPYKVTEFVAGDKVVMERFADFWGEVAPFDKLTFQKVSEVASRVTGLVNGEFDLITNIPPDQEKALAVDGIKTAGAVPPLLHVWVINMSVGATQDPLVRKAMRYCTDHQALVDGLWAGKAKVPTTLQYPEVADFYWPDLQLERYDPVEARRLLAEAGYKGEPVIAQFTKSYYLYGDLAAQVIQQQWKECGINLELQQIEKYDYSVANFRAWSNPLYYPDPMGVMDTHWSKASSMYQEKLWQPQSPEWDTTYEVARFSTDPEARKSAYRKLLELSDAESGWIQLYQPYELYAMRDGLSFSIPPNDRPYVLPLRAGEAILGD